VDGAIAASLRAHGHSWRKIASGLGVGVATARAAVFRVCEKGLKFGARNRLNLQPSTEWPIPFGKELVSDTPPIRKHYGVTGGNWTLLRGEDELPLRPCGGLWHHRGDHSSPKVGAIGHS
jgi:hypothetical protein